LNDWLVLVVRLCKEERVGRKIFLSLVLIEKRTSFGKNFGGATDAWCNSKGKGQSTRKCWALYSVLILGGYWRELNGVTWRAKYKLSLVFNV